MRVTHFATQPKGMLPWDFYVLCGLDAKMAMVLQKMEYWDGTKQLAAEHAEAENDQRRAAQKPADQDESRWVYKSQDELQWELMGLVGETNLATILNKLDKNLHYLHVRPNPHVAYDRRKQYYLNDELLASHVDYLAYLIDFFVRAKRRTKLVFYAIERLIADKETIATISIPMVMQQIQVIQAEADEEDAKRKANPKGYVKQVIPHFIRDELSKEQKLPSLSLVDMTPFRNFTDWSHSVESRNAPRFLTESNPFFHGSNSIDYVTEITTKNTDSSYTQSKKNNARANAHANDESSLSSKKQKATAPAQPSQEEKPSRSKISLSSAAAKFLDSWDGRSSCPINRSDREVIKQANYMAEVAERVELWEIMRVKQRMEKQDYWVKAGGLPFIPFAKNFQAQHSLFKRDLAAGAILEPMDVETRNAEREELCAPIAEVEDEHEEDMRMLNLLPETHHVFKMRSELYLKKYGRPYVRPIEQKVDSSIAS